MLRNDWPVADYGIRPRGQPDKCFYCDATKGTQHRSGCVIRHRTVVIRTIVEHVIDVPEDWTKETIEFTEGSSCSDNHVRELGWLLESLKASSQCTCGMLAIEYVSEATEEDEKRSARFIADCSS